MGYIDSLYNQDENEPGDKRDVARRKKAAEEKGTKASVRHTENILTEESLGIGRGKAGFKGKDISKEDKDSILKRALKSLEKTMGYNPAEKDADELNAIYKQGDKTHKRWHEAKTFWDWKRSQK